MCIYLYMAVHLSAVVGHESDAVEDIGHEQALNTTIQRGAADEGWGHIHLRSIAHY